MVDDLSSSFRAYNVRLKCEMFPNQDYAALAFASLFTCPSKGITT